MADSTTSLQSDRSNARSHMAVRHAATWAEVRFLAGHDAGDQGSGKSHKLAERGAVPRPATTVAEAKVVEAPSCDVGDSGCESHQPPHTSEPRMIPYAELDANSTLPAS